ncbi:hypothetical protein Bind_3370 [Beijerinckia indica subsp. indica ATCC 9039]|uniref:Uncharacterized protein n=1 Tax=Beijerinckia indica subsp. indica (strain ATCC 9039 / DSM 1715 / NCIMB 8712) TaxID=395963 RepID=B2IDZ5_BEII9|nr:hypothetical protein Bind_3370 [Beijerinckia indica subsp. indica ATCC 9039]
MCQNHATALAGCLVGARRGESIKSKNRHDFWDEFASDSDLKSDALVFCSLIQRERDHGHPMASNSLPSHAHVDLTRGRDDWAKPRSRKTSFSPLENIIHHLMDMMLDAGGTRDVSTFIRCRYKMKRSVLLLNSDPMF